MRPDLVLADDRLDVGLDGAGLAATLGLRLGTPVPAVILAADDTPAGALPPGVSVLTKPARPATVLATIGALLPQDKVFRVEPSSGSKVPPGTAVTLFVSPF